MAIVHRSSELPISVDLAFELAASAETFAYLVSPWLSVRGVETPAEVEPGAVGSARLWWLGVLPSWRHEIRLVRMTGREIYTNEHGGPVRTWNHRLTFEPLGPTRCRYTDEIEVDDGLAGLGTRVFARLMFRHRHRRWRALARVLAGTSVGGRAGEPPLNDG